MFERIHTEEDDIRLGALHPHRVEVPALWEHDVWFLISCWTRGLDGQNLREVQITEVVPARKEWIAGILTLLQPKFSLSFVVDVPDTVYLRYNEEGVERVNYNTWTGTLAALNNLGGVATSLE